MTLFVVIRKISPGKFVSSSVPDVSPSMTFSSPVVEGKAKSIILDSELSFGLEVKHPG
jgi:hypothetical protein